MPTEADNKILYKILPFDHNIHNRKLFSCGVKTIDNYLKLIAKKAVKNNVARVWVIIDSNNNIIGFYAINMHSIFAKNMPKSYVKKSLKDGTLPVAFISMIAVSTRQQGKKIGSILLADSLKRIYQLSGEIGTCAALLDIYDDGDKVAIQRRLNYYKKFGFIPLPSQPLRLFIPIEIIKDLNSC